MDQPTESTFEYRIEEKVLIIENGEVLNGHWLLIQLDWYTNNSNSNMRLWNYKKLEVF